MRISEIHRRRGVQYGTAHGRCGEVNQVVHQAVLDHWTTKGRHQKNGTIYARMKPLHDAGNSFVADKGYSEGSSILTSSILNRKGTVRKWRRHNSCRRKNSQSVIEVGRVLLTSWSRDVAFCKVVNRVLK